MLASVSDRRRARLELGRLLSAVEDAPPVAAADVVGQQLARALDATEVAFLIADFSGQALIRLTRSGNGAGERSQGPGSAGYVPLAEGAYARVLASQNVEVADGDDGVRVFAPVTNRGEAIGVLELVLPRPPDEQTLAEVALGAHALAYIVVANRRFTDLFEWGQRSVPLSLAAEIQRRLLPGSYTCEAGQFTLAGWLEPAGEVAGDTFDFSLERDTVHLSLTDAMGHDVEAAVLATVLVSALRNSRRAGVELADQAASASAALAGHVKHSEFVTGQLVRIDLNSAAARVVNAGHPCPLRLRDGTVESVPLKADPPFGTVEDYEYRVQKLPLERGDRLFFLTDGVLERNPAGVHVPELIAASADEHPREAVQHLMTAVREAVDDNLKDDATAMCLDWHGGPRRKRTTSAGANR